jgi:two-component system, sensor histidine kinase and response regulator
MNLFYKFLDFKRTPYIIAGVIFLCSLVVLSCFKSAESQLTVLNQAVRFNTILNKSSDDLTNYARYFVTTKDHVWRNEFDNVLKVRNGVVADEQGVKKSFRDRVKEVQFTQEELDMLLKAEQLSNNLAKLEVQAFELIDQSREVWDYVVQSQKITQAQVLMFGNDYKTNKQQIITTSNEFYAMVVNRLQSQYQFYMTTAWTMIIVINLSLILLVIAVNHKSIAVTATPKRPVRKTPAAKKVAKKVARKIK